MAITSFLAGEAISAGDAVYVSSSGVIYKADVTTVSRSSVAGLALDTGTNGNLIRVNSDSSYTAASGLTAGEYRYLSPVTAGKNVPYSVWVSGVTQLYPSGAYLTIVGKALSSTSLAVEISRPIFVDNPNGT